MAAPKGPWCISMSSEQGIFTHGHEHTSNYSPEIAILGLYIKGQGKAK